jgi:hypothetical protein
LVRYGVPYEKIRPPISRETTTEASEEGPTRITESEARSPGIE